MKTLIGIEKIKFEKKDTGKVTNAIRFHMLEDAGYGGEDVTGQRVIQETLWGLEDINDIKVSGKLEIGCHITVYYEGEGNFKKPSLIMCEK